MRFDEICVITFFAVFTCILCREFEQTRKIVVQIGTRAFQFLLEVRYLIADPCMADPLSRCQPPSKFLATPLSSYPQNSVVPFLPSQGPSDHLKGSFNTSKSPPLTILERAPIMCVDKFIFILFYF